MTENQIFEAIMANRSMTRDQLETKIRDSKYPSFSADFHRLWWLTQQPEFAPPLQDETGAVLKTPRVIAKKLELPKARATTVQAPAPPAKEEVELRTATAGASKKGG